MMVSLLVEEIIILSFDFVLLFGFVRPIETLDCVLQCAFCDLIQYHDGGSGVVFQTKQSNQDMWGNFPHGRTRWM
jgi:hypothetical protein